MIAGLLLRRLVGSFGFLTLLAGFATAAWSAEPPPGTKNFNPPTYAPDYFSNESGPFHTVGPARPRTPMAAPAYVAPTAVARPAPRQEEPRRIYAVHRTRHAVFVERSSRHHHSSHRYRHAEARHAAAHRGSHARREARAERGRHLQRRMHAHGRTARHSTLAVRRTAHHSRSGSGHG